MTKLLLALVLLLAQQTGRSINGVVTGEIRTPDGAPAADVRVSALSVQRDAQQSTEVLMSIAQTDSRGRYRLEELPAGGYTIVAGPLVRPTYFPGIALQKDATVLTVSAQTAVIDGINFTVIVPQRVRGRIIVEYPGGGASASPPPMDRPMMVMLYQEGISQVAESPLAEISLGARPDIQFEFPAVWPGTYRVRFTGPQFYYVKSITVGSTNLLTSLLEIGAASPEELRLTLVVPGKEVAGSVTLDGESLPPRFFRSSYPVLAFLGPDGPKRNYVNFGVNPDGFFTYRLMEGEYRILLAGLPPDGLYLKSITMGSVDLLTSRLKIGSQGDTPAGLPLVVTYGDVGAGPTPASLNESMAVGSLRRVNRAQAVYQTRHDGIPGDMRALIDDRLLEARFADAVSGYTFAMTVSGREYTASATPASKTAGRYMFTTAPDGVIRQSMALESSADALHAHDAVLTPAESAAVADLLMVELAELQYRRQYGSAGDLDELAASRLLDARFPWASRGYKFSVTLTDNGYSLAAVPTDRESGLYGFNVTQDRELLYSTNPNLAPDGLTGAPVR